MDWRVARSVCTSWRHVAIVEQEPHTFNVAIRGSDPDIRAVSNAPHKLLVAWSPHWHIVARIAARYFHVTSTTMGKRKKATRKPGAGRVKMAPLGSFLR